MNNNRTGSKLLLVVSIFIIIVLFIKFCVNKESFLDMFFSSGCSTNNTETPTPPLRFNNFSYVEYPKPNFLNNSKMYEVNNNRTRQPYRSPLPTICNTNNDCKAAEKCEDNICCYNTPLMEAENENENTIYYSEGCAPPIIMKDNKK